MCVTVNPSQVNLGSGNAEEILLFPGESVEGWGLANQLSESDGKHLCQDQSPALKAAKGEDWDSSTWL